ncbi:hypothetical protein BX070DRAFT_9973 [Coemansia spiralis]|nr:hypothetical protein BX070DRAFT_9973 [Coemansia spiralis]
MSEHPLRFARIFILFSPLFILPCPRNINRRKKASSFLKRILPQMGSNSDGGVNVLVVFLLLLCCVMPLYRAA